VTSFASLKAILTPFSFFLKKPYWVVVVRYIFVSPAKSNWVSLGYDYRSGRPTRVSPARLAEMTNNGRTAPTFRFFSYHRENEAHGRRGNLFMQSFFLVMLSLLKNPPPPHFFSYFQRTNQWRRDNWQPGIRKYNIQKELGPLSLSFTVQILLLYLQYSC